MTRLRLLVEAETRLWREIESRLSQAGLPRLAWLETLAALAKRIGARVNDVATDLAITAGGATKLVDAVERGGMLTRQAHPTDRRVTIVSPTPAGLEALQRGRAIVDECVAEFWPSGDLDSPLREMREHLEAAGR